MLNMAVHILTTGLETVAHVTAVYIVLASVPRLFLGTRRSQVTQTNATRLLNFVLTLCQNCCDIYIYQTTRCHNPAKYSSVSPPCPLRKLTDRVQLAATGRLLQNTNNSLITPTTVHYSPPLDLMLSHLNPAHTRVYYLVY